MTIIARAYACAVSRGDETPYAGSLAFLLSQVGAHSAELFARQLGPLGISPRTFGVLSNLAGTGSRTQQQLADALGIHRNRMVGLIDEVEAAGLARRHRSPSDRRAFEVRLTPAGSELVERVNALIPVLDRELGKGLKAGERDELAALLRRAADALELSPGIHPYLRGS